MPMTDMDRVRLEIGDNEAPMHFADDEIWEKINQFGGNWLAAAADLCFSWARYILTHWRDFSIGRFSESGAVAAAAALNEKGKELQKKVSMSSIGTYVGGISVSDRTAKENDSDRTPSTFRRGYMDNPDSGWSR